MDANLGSCAGRNAGPGRRFPHALRFRFCLPVPMLAVGAWSIPAAVLGLVLVVPRPIQAQVLPDAGRLLNDVSPMPVMPPAGTEVLPLPPPVEPALTLQSDVRFAIARFEINDVSAFDAEQLQHLLDDLRGPERNLAALELAVTRITLFYRQHGYLLARAYLPEQNIDGGVVEIHVLEGRLGNIVIDNSSRLSSDVVQRRLQRIGMDQALQGAALESSLLLLSDTPGIVVRSALAPGTVVGSTDLHVVITEARAVDGDVSFDNDGNRYTGQYHGNANITINNPSGIGDQLSANVISAGGEFNYGRINYQLPLNDVGTRLAFSYASMAYRLGQDFAELDAYGVARIAGVSLTHPLLRSRAFNINGQVRFEHKLLVDRIGLTSDGSEKSLNNLTLSLFGDASTSASQNLDSLSVTWGKLTLDQASAALDATGHRTDGNFVKGNLQWTRLQRLNEPTSVLLQVNAQLSGSNLDSAEKMSMGGPYAVRAYPAGEAPADDVLMLNLELRRTLTPQWQGLLFGDIARGRLNHSPINTDGNNLRTLSGLGLGGRWNGPDGYRGQAILAWRTDSAPVSDHDKAPRFWLQMAKVF